MSSVNVYTKINNKNKHAAVVRGAGHRWSRFGARPSRRRGSTAHDAALTLSTALRAGTCCIVTSDSALCA